MYGCSGRLDDDNDGEDYEDYCSILVQKITPHLNSRKAAQMLTEMAGPDILDPFKDDPTEWSDTDGDDVGNNSDAFIP